MSSDPSRLWESEEEDLVDLREAVNEARELTPDAAWYERMTRKLEDALEPPQAVDEHAEGDTRDRVDPEPPPLEPAHRAEVTSEGRFSETTAEVVEAEVAGGLTAGLLAAGAAVAWLRRRTTRPPPDDENT